MPIFCPLFNRLNPHIWYLHFTPAQTFLALFGWHPRKGNTLALNNSSLEWMRTKPWLDLWLSKAFYGCTHFSFLKLNSCRIDVSIDIFIGKCNCVIKMHHCLVLITVCKTGLFCIGKFQIEIHFISTSKRFDSTLTGTQTVCFARNRKLCWTSQMFGKGRKQRSLSGQTLWHHTGLTSRMVEAGSLMRSDRGTVTEAIQDKRIWITLLWIVSL